MQTGKHTKQDCTEHIISLLAGTNIEGIISQEHYDYLVESIKYQFDMTLQEARKAVTKTLKHLYVSRAG